MIQKRTIDSMWKKKFLKCLWQLISIAIMFQKTLGFLQYKTIIKLQSPIFLRLKEIISIKFIFLNLLPNHCGYSPNTCYALNLGVQNSNKTLVASW